MISSISCWSERIINPLFNHLLNCYVGLWLPFIMAGAVFNKCVTSERIISTPLRNKKNG